MKTCSRILHALAVASLGWGALFGVPASAQTFPSKPFRIVVPFGAGGVADLTARTVAQKMSESMGQAVVIENKPGAGGVAAGDTVAKAEPDGHTLLLMSNGTAVSAGLFKSLPFDAVRDFAPISTLGYFDIAVLTAANPAAVASQAAAAVTEAAGKERAGESPNAVAPQAAETETQAA